MGTKNSKASKSIERDSTATTTNLNMTNNVQNEKLPIVGAESIMSKKKHGTSETPVQTDLRWGCDWDTADRICNFNVSETVSHTFTSYCHRTLTNYQSNSDIMQNTLVISKKQNFLLKH
jgi:hypothetical protein